MELLNYFTICMFVGGFLFVWKCLYFIVHMFVIAYSTDVKPYADFVFIRVFDARSIFYMSLSVSLSVRHTVFYVSNMALWCHQISLFASLSLAVLLFRWLQFCRVLPPALCIFTRITYYQLTDLLFKMCVYNIYVSVSFRFSIELDIVFSP